jgi:Flp pilus assembly protein TadG
MSLFRRPDQRTADCHGVAGIEFALLAPFVILVMLAGADLSLFMRSVMRMDETSTEVAVAVTQYANLYDSDFTLLFLASQTIANTTPVSGLFGATIISGVVNTGGRQTIAWQKISPSATFKSLIGVAGAVPVLPNSYVLPTGGTLIAVEVFTTASPWVLSATLMGGPGSSSIRSYALFQPRLGSLSVVTAGNRP